MLANVRAPQWPGTALIAAGLGLAAYAVFIGRVLLTPDVARRSFSRSLAAGLLIALYVAALLGVDRLAQRLFALDAPLVAALALVLTLALLDPLRDRLRAYFGRRAARRDEAYRRLLRALGDDLATSPRPEAALAPALALPHPSGSPRGLWPRLRRVLRALRSLLPSARYLPPATTAVWPVAGPSGASPASRGLPPRRARHTRAPKMIHRGRKAITKASGPPGCGSW